MLVLLSFETEAEKDTFEYMYEKYKRLLFAKAYDILKDYGLAEDAVSEAFIRVYKHMHRIDNPDSGQTAAFLVTIVKNLAITLYHKRNKVIPADFGENEEASDFDLEKTIEMKDEAQNAVKLVEKLGEELKAVFLLKYAHDLPHKEIGRILGISENNVTVKLHREKKKLATWVESAKEVRQA
jgi:RNA polymerase sigma-70 factor (ECF subfamily)